MSSIPSNLSRISTLLSAQLGTSRLARTNLAMFRVQQQMVTGRALLRPSDDAVMAATVSVLDAELGRGAQRLRNYSHASSSLQTLDAALGDAHDLVLEAKQIASAQASFGSDADERAAQARVVDTIIQSMLDVANRESVAGYIFGGTAPGSTPVSPAGTGFRYAGAGAGLLTDLGLGAVVPITLGLDGAVGATSARVRGDVDLDPALTGDTRIDDLRGARGAGVQPGGIEFSFEDGPRGSIDLSHADTLQDVVDALEAGLRRYEADNGVTILAEGGVSFTAKGLRIAVVGNPRGPDPELEFFDIGTGTTARDLGLADDPPIVIRADTPPIGDLDPELTWLTPMAALTGAGAGFGQIRITNNGRSAVIDLSSAVTLEDVRNLIETENLGVRVRIGEGGRTIDLVSEVAAGRDGALSVEDVDGSDGTATRLGIRSMTARTRIAEFNDGRGVQINTGSVDPDTGLPDPSRDVDMAITLGDGSSFTVDFRPEDMLTVRTLLTRINDEAARQGIDVPGRFRATLSESFNGIVLEQDPSLGGPVTVERRNNSPAWSQLGFADGRYDSNSATFIAQDRATVRVHSVLTHLIDLRDALLADDTDGITLAGEELENSVDALARTRALVGGFAQRVDSATRRQEDQTVLDEKLASEVRDLDYAEAAVRFAALQTQLQAGLRVTALSGQQTLLDFLG